MVAYVAAEDAAVLLGKVERDVVDMIREGDLTEANFRGAMDGYYEMLQVRRADVLSRDVDEGWRPVVEEA